MQIQQKCHADGCVFRFEESHADTAEMLRGRMCLPVWKKAMQLQQKCYAVRAERDDLSFGLEESHADTAEMPRSPCLRRDCPGHCLHFKDLRQADAGRKEPHAAVPVSRHQTAAVTVLLPDFSVLQTASV